MASILYRLGLGAARHRLAVVLIWAGVLIASAVGALTLSGPTSNSFDIPGQESTQALQLMEQRFGTATSGAAAQVVLQAPAGDQITGPNGRQKVDATVATLKSISGVASVSNPFDPNMPVISQDQTTTYVNVAFSKPAPELTDDQRTGLSEAVSQARSSGLIAEVTGEATQETHTSATEGIGVVIALVILAITFGSLVTAGMNLLTALVGVGVGLLGITTLTGFVELQATTSALASMLGLAVGIDYALFIVTRFRQQLLAGSDVREAAALAVGTAGSAVVTAGITVVIALAGLSLSGIPFLTQMGLAAAGTVVIAVLVAITLVPAALAYIGRRSLRKAQRTNYTETIHEPPRYITRWSSLITNHRGKVLLATVAVLGVIAIPFASLQTSLTIRPEEGSTQQRATEILNAKFGDGFTGPLLVLIDGNGAAQRTQAVVQESTTFKDVAVAAPVGALPDGSAALLSIIPQSSPDSLETINLVQDLRDRFSEESGPKAYVTGTTAVGVDVSQKLNETLPLYLAVVVGLAFVLLILVFRSILVPLVGVLGFLLTISASFGAMVAVFQWGWLSDLINPGMPGPVLSFAPIIVIGILFGLAMDYQVFLVSRIHEAHAHSEDPKPAIVMGFKQSAPVVLAAAAIMFGVFAGFTSGDATVKLIAFTLAVGIFFDAVVVRMLAVPAAIGLMGKAAWRFPKWLSWLPELDVEGRALENRK